jgi:hypothetical protein
VRRTVISPQLAVSTGATQNEKAVPTMRYSSLLLLAAGLALPILPAAAETAAGRHPHKASRAAKPTAPQPSGTSINTPSTDFSTVERAGDDDAPRSDGGSMRPVMAPSGNIGLGTGF